MNSLSFVLFLWHNYVQYPYTDSFVTCYCDSFINPCSNNTCRGDNCQVDYDTTTGLTRRLCSATFTSCTFPDSGNCEFQSTSLHWTWILWICTYTCESVPKPSYMHSIFCKYCSVIYFLLLCCTRVHVDRGICCQDAECNKCIIPDGLSYEQCLNVTMPSDCPPVNCSDLIVTESPNESGKLLVTEYLQIVHPVTSHKY